MGVVFGLLTSLSIGLADLFGRRVANARGPIVTGVLMQFVAVLTSLLAVAVVVASRFLVGDVLIGMASGLGTGVGLAAYFVGVTRSTSAVVAPLVAVVSAVIPYVYALARGASATAVGVVGAVVAVGGIAVITLGGGRVVSVATGVRWGLLSGVGFGVGLSVVIEASDESGSWPAVGQRLAALALMVGVAGASRVEWRVPVGLVGSGLLAGAFAGMSTVLFLLGLEAEPASAIIAGSVFPAFTVVVGRVVYGDEVLPRQVGGLGIVLVGVILLSLP